MLARFCVEAEPKRGLDASFAAAEGATQTLCEGCKRSSLGRGNLVMGGCYGFQSLAAWLTHVAKARLSKLFCLLMIPWSPVVREVTMLLWPWTSGRIE